MLPTVRGVQVPFLFVGIFSIFNFLATFVVDFISSYWSNIYWTIFASLSQGLGNLVSGSHSYPKGTVAPFHSPFWAREIITEKTRSPVSFLSSSANTKIIFSIASPIAVEVSNCSLREINVTLYFFNSSYISEKSLKFLLIRSIFHTIKWVNSPILILFIISWYAGLSVVPPE